MAGGASLGKAGLGWAKWASRLTGRTGWILLTTAVVTLVPLVFEVRNVSAYPVAYLAARAHPCLGGMPYLRVLLFTDIRAHDAVLSRP